MRKEKSRLEIASEEVKSLVQQTNAKICELGEHDETIYRALTDIQKQFDRIRNIPSDTLLEYRKLKEERLTWKQQVDKINEDYVKAKKARVGMGAAGAALGAGVVFLGPMVATRIAKTYGVTSTGTAIAALHGAAANNAALAWLGGGALSAGGGGKAAGTTRITLAKPVGWTIVLLTILASGFLSWKARSRKKKLEEIFLLISKRDKTSYELALVELNERIHRITAETLELQTARMNIGTFGTDYHRMTEAQQYALGSYVNLMNASTRLLVNPILGLQPKYREEDLKHFLAHHAAGSCSHASTDNKKNLILYMANLLYKIDTEESDRKLLADAFRKNKDFLKSMEVGKEDMNPELLNLVDCALKHAYAVNRTRILSPAVRGSR